jgi:Mg2+ and Co2+ transporter CorA
MGIIVALFCATVVVYPITLIVRWGMNWKSQPQENRKQWRVYAVLAYLAVAAHCYALELGACKLFSSNSIIRH